ncbi:MAG: Peptidyl-prolyl cis-trans isomerase precursor [Planctomycetota bacterium]|jgi:cyclophilin family peptidyl-prolyl cis-trans isomerase
MWGWRNQRNRQRRAGLHPTGAPAELLETRALLAGNVEVRVNGEHIQLHGDDANNAVRIRRGTSGIVVEGLESTTINGGNDVVQISADASALSGRLWIFMNGGDDKAVIASGITAPLGFRVYGGAGNDSLSAIGTTFQRLAGFFGDDGNDTVVLQDCVVNGSLQIFADAGDDLVSLTGTAINGEGLVNTYEGSDRVSCNNVTGGGRLDLRTGNGDDTVTVRNSTRSGLLNIATRRGQDSVMFEDNTFNGPVNVLTGAQNDAVHLRDGSTFNGPLSVNGTDSRRNDFGDIPGGDQFKAETGNTFNGGISTLKFEGSEIPSPVTTRYDGTNNAGGLIRDAAAADSAASALAANFDLTATASSAQSVNGTGNVLITRTPNISIAGKTVAGATITVDADGDGQFDDGTATADASGNYTVTTALTRTDLYTNIAGDDGLTGRRSVNVRGAVANVGQRDVAVEVDYVTGSVVEFTSELGTYHLELFDQQAPGVTANFLKYTNPQPGETTGRYTNSIIHRSVSNFVIQGGGFTIDGGVIDEVPLDSSVTGEFSAQRTNIKGTISMAHAGDPNVLTSQWFINTVDNPSLDDFDGRRHTVFGRLVGNSQTVVDAIAALPKTNLNSQSGSGALGEVPLRTPFTEFSRSLTGTVSTNSNSTRLIGTGTKFITELKGALFGLRSRIQINGQTFFVASIDSDTELTLSQAPTFSAVNVSAKTDFQDSSFVKFTTARQLFT